MSENLCLIPAIDLKGGKCVRLQEGEASRATEYGDDPVAMALHWKSLGARLLHLVDLDGAFSGSPIHLEIVRRIIESAGIPVQIGGGIRSIARVEEFLNMGAARVILGTVAVEHPEVVESSIREFGSEAILVGIDSRGGEAAVRGWIGRSGVSAVELGLRVQRLGVRRIIYTDVSRDGMLRGVNIAETERMARETSLKIIASGGVAGLADLQALSERRHLGIEGVILGRALYEGRVHLPEALAAVDRGLS
jgi:phosphoribosylformimino-5-aminoimidazole carboxamide ribotide isomerase